MNFQETIELLRERILSDILETPERKLTPDTPLISSGLIDSFHLVDVAMTVEELFGVRIEDYELNADTFDTVEQLAELIQKRRG